MYFRKRINWKTGESQSQKYFDLNLGFQFAFQKSHAFKTCRLRPRKGLLRCTERPAL